MHENHPWNHLALSSPSTRISKQNIFHYCKEWNFAIGVTNIYEMRKAWNGGSHKNIEVEMMGQQFLLVLLTAPGKVIYEFSQRNPIDIIPAMSKLTFWSCLAGPIYYTCSKRLIHDWDHAIICCLKHSHTTWHNHIPHVSILRYLRIRFDTEKFVMANILKGWFSKQIAINK